MSERGAFLKRVREAVIAGNRAGEVSALPERGSIGYQGSGDADLLTRFVEMCAAMGAFPIVLSSREQLVAKLREILAAKKSDKVLLGGGEFLDGLDLEAVLRETPGREITRLGRGLIERSTIFAADLGITGVSALIAETGSLVVSASPTEPRSGSLLPPVHLAVVHKSQIVPDLFDALAGYSAENRPPSNLVLITGPSKTGDIELKLVTGVHGPGEVHVLVLDR